MKIVEQPWSEGLAHHVYNILVEFCGAPETERFYFLQRQTRNVTKEYCIEGILGDSATLYRGEYGRPLYVSCASEDETPERSLIIEKVNFMLQLIVDEESASDKSLR